MDEKKEILQRVSDLESEVSLLKRELALLKSERSGEVPHEKQHIIRKNKKEETPQPIVSERQSAFEQDVPQKAPKKEFDFEKQISVWLPRVFMFILLLGVLWDLKVGMEYGLITGLVRIALGFIASGVLYFLGMRYLRNGKNGFGLTLLGGFIALGILTTFAAHHLYGYFNFFVALVVGIAYIAAGLYLSLKTKSETLTIFSGIAGFLLPFLLAGQVGSDIQFCLYILLLFLSLFFVSLRHQHKYSFYVSFLLFHLTLLAYVVLGWFEINEKIIVATAFIQHLLLLVAYIKGYIARQVFTETLIYTNFVFVLGWIKFLDYQQEIILFGLVAALYITLAAWAFSKKKEMLCGVLSAVAIFASSAFILAFQTEELYGKLMLLLINGAIGLWVGLYYQTIRTIITGGMVYVLAVYTTLVAVDFTEFWTIQHMVWLVLITTLCAIYYSFYRWRPAFIGKTTLHLDQSLIAGQLILVVYVFKLVQLFLQDTNWSFQTSMHIQLAILVALLGALYLLNKWQHGRFITHAVVVEFLLASFVVLGLGVGGDSFGNVFSFNLVVQLVYVVILTVIFLAILSNTFYISLKWKTGALAVIMQAIYFIFLNKWYFALVMIGNWSTEWILLVHTFWLFGFAFVSLTIGRKMKWKAVRIIGVLLIGVCLLKLFIIDLNSISILIRSILFTVVGVAGLLYSRTLWKD
ncbi:DUF2339 domain-containing protein [Sporosarcina obsidiansis]|uniref:DUF2339 domain-containing protein n=1 Tax=Sporosarcina obsidiansis TaxID=2660748 RepID=UPI00129BCA17|nr:DUF2339 domain-containing protein [Sporosarcina obsidiansis]